MVRYSIRDVLWLTVVVALACASWLAHGRSVYLQSEVARYQRLAEDRKAQFDSLAEQWQQQLPKSIKIGDKGRVTVKHDDGTTVGYRP